MKQATETAAVIVKRVFPYPPKTLFEAFSNPETMDRWFFSGPSWSVKASNDFRTGGNYSIVMRNEKGEDIPHTGIYKEIIPDQKLVFTWNSRFAEDSVVTISFRKNGDGTEVTLVHEFLSEPMRDAHLGGWNGCFDRLNAFLAPANG